jgi:cysteine/O-acetylserine efflux protein
MYIISYPKKEEKYFMNFAAFFSYIFLTAFTPGPNNIMAMSLAGKYGFRESIRFNLGVFFGFLAVMTGCCAFTSLLYRFIPLLEPFMVYAGAGYILWLAWSIWRDNPRSGKHNLETNSFLNGMILQFVNAKVILYGLTAMTTFILPNYKSYPALALFIFLLSLMGFLGTSCWALSGAAFNRFFSSHRKILNLSMALLLAYCAISLAAKGI